MSNPFLPRCAPIWGFPAHMTIADLSPAKQQAVPIAENVAVDTTSAAVELGARGVELILTFEDRSATCDVTLLVMNGPVPATVKTWTGVGGSKSLFAGNLEMVDLEGKPIKVVIENISAGFVNVAARATY